MHSFDVLDHLLSSGGPGRVRGEPHWDAITSDATNLGELAAIRWSWFQTSNVDLVSLLPGNRTHPLLPPLGTLGPLLEEGTFEHGEVTTIPSEDSGWLSGSPFLRFEERMKNRLVACGVPSKLAFALAGALHEMASNAAEHARSPLPPVAIFDVRDQRWSFSVSDVGVGMIGSLSENPQFQNLGNDVTALRTALTDGVSRTGQPGRGNGFHAVFRPFADRACAIRFRSIGAVVNWTGAAPAAHLMSFEPAPRRHGLHVQLTGSI